MLKQVDDVLNTGKKKSIEKYYDTEVKPNLLAVSRVFAEARKQMNLAEYKTFTYALSNIKWTEKCPDTLYLDKKDVARVVGINSDIDHLSINLNRAIGEMPKHSFLQFADKHKQLFLNGNFVRTVAMFKNVVRIKLEEDFLNLFGNLETDYITLWSADIYKMRSERSVIFYELLRDNSDTRLSVNTAELGIKALKELFNIPKDGKGSYMTPDGHFARTHFEKYVIDPLCSDLINTEMIKLVIQPDGKFYEKIKKGNKVIGYRFHWILSLRPKIATAEAVKQLQERVDKDPKVLKIAKNIAEGEKKAPKKKDKFCNFEERKYDTCDFEELEKRYAKN